MRTATPDDLDGLTETISLAFRDDPLWSWAFPDGSGMPAWWRFLLTSALRYPLVFVADDIAAVAVWIPPGGVELTDEEEAQVEPLMHELVGERTPSVMGLLDAFDASHPKDRPHYYLSLLGTHPDSRGRGVGMGLLAETLTEIDREQMPAYLESSNKRNVPRYESAGFEITGDFSTPDGSRTVDTMWREPAPV